MDIDEQIATIQGLLKALDGRADEIDSAHLWCWSFESNRWDSFGMDPNFESDSQAAAQMVQDFLLGEELW